MGCIVKIIAGANFHLNLNNKRHFIKKYKKFKKSFKKPLTLNFQYAIIIMRLMYGGIAQLARAPALQAGGQRFESAYLHQLQRLDKCIYQV